MSGQSNHTLKLEKLCSNICTYSRLQCNSTLKNAHNPLYFFKCVQISVFWSPHLLKKPHTRYSLSNPTNPCFLTAVSNFKSLLSCSTAQLWIDNWKVKRRRLIFDSIVGLKTAAPPRAAGLRLLRLMWETLVNQSSGWPLGGLPSLCLPILPSVQCSAGF